MKFKYFDNIVTRGNGYIGSYSDFITANPDFPLVSGEYFEYGDNGFFTINHNGGGSPTNPVDYLELTQAITKTYEINPNILYQESDIGVKIELDTITLSEKPSSDYVLTGFFVINNNQVWQIRDKTPQELILENNISIINQITVLEARQTPRRMREALTDPTWMNNLDSQIVSLRLQLQ